MATTPGAQLADFKGNEQNIQFNGEPNAVARNPPVHRWHRRHFVQLLHRKILFQIKKKVEFKTTRTRHLKLLTYANLNPVMLIYPLDRLITGFAHCD